MDGLPVTIRLLDPPLHEFLPHEGPALTKLCTQLAKELHSTGALVKVRAAGGGGGGGGAGSHGGSQGLGGWVGWGVSGAIHETRDVHIGLVVRVAITGVDLACYCLPASFLPATTTC